MALSLTPEQIAAIRAILDDASQAIAISTFGVEPDKAIVDRLVEEGYLTREVALDLARTAFSHGVLTGREADQQAFAHAADQASRQLTFDDLLKRQNKIPLSDAEKRAREIAADRAGQYCVGLGNRWSDTFNRVLVDADHQLANNTRGIIRDKTKVAIEERKTRGQLKSDLRQATQDWTRDWDRIAHTEMQNAHQEGVFESIVERKGMEALLARVPDPGACDDCKRLLLDHDGKPLIRPASWWAEQGSNVGRKKRDWKPTLSTIHPHCRCETVHVPNGWEFTDDWELVPPGEKSTAVFPSDLQKGGENSIGVSPSPSKGRPLRAKKVHPRQLNLFKAYKLHYRTTFAGIPISIENRKGSYRRWKDPHSGEEGRTYMSLPYGYINLPQADHVDGDKIDVYLGPVQDAPMVYVVHQLKSPDFTEFDENKVMLGFPSRSEAERAYLAHYDSPDFHGHIDEIPLERFRKDLLAGKYKGKVIRKSGSGPLAGQAYSGQERHAGVTGSGAWLVDSQRKRTERIIQMTSTMKWLEEWAEQHRRSGQKRIVLRPKPEKPFDRPLSSPNPPQADKQTGDSLEAYRSESAKRHKERMDAVEERVKPGREASLKLHRWYP
jgi:hypothetical protein